MIRPSETHDHFIRRRLANPPTWKGLAVIVGLDGPAKNSAIGRYQRMPSVTVRWDINGGHHPRQIEKRYRQARSDAAIAQNILLVSHACYLLNLWSRRLIDEDGEQEEHDPSCYERVLVSDARGVILRLTELHHPEWLWPFRLGDLYEREAFGSHEAYGPDETDLARVRGKVPHG